MKTILHILKRCALLEHCVKEKDLLCLLKILATLEGRMKAEDGGKYLYFSWPSVKQTNVKLHAGSYYVIACMIDDSLWAAQLE